MKLDTTKKRECNCGEHEMEAWCEYCKFWMCIEIGDAHATATGHKFVIVEA